MAMKRRIPAVFLDKDGTLVDDIPFNVDPGRMRLAQGAREGLQRLARAGYALVVVSNQPGVAMGRFPEHALAAVEQRLRDLMAMCGASLLGFYYCPHLPANHIGHYRTPCLCRKPAPGLIRRAAAEHGLDLRRSWMVGDILDDVEAGRRAGCRSILIDNGNETEWDLCRKRTPHGVAGDLEEAAAHIVTLDEARGAAARERCG
jgi:histidinol-phosphate phosphatase family protein